MNVEEVKIDMWWNVLV